MSVQAMTWALEQKVVSDATARHVLLCLANYADKGGKAAFPSVKSLSDDTGLSERTVRYKLDLLEEAGVIVKGNQAIAAAHIDRHDRRPVVYDIVMARGAGAACRDERGANEDAPGCSSRQNRVQTKTERGAGAAPNLSLNRPLPVNEPSLSDFDRFWTLYPKKVKRKDALKAWTKLKPSAELQQTLIAALGRHCVSQDWIKHGGQYIPLASSWLNGERWEDDLKPGAAAGQPSAYTNLPQHTPEMYQGGSDGPQF